MKEKDAQKHIETAAGCPIFANVGRHAVMEALTDAQCELINFRKGEEISSRGLIVLLSGIAEISKPASDGRRIVMRTVGAGQPVNAAAVFTGESMSGITALKDGEAAVFPAGAVVRMFERDAHCAVSYVSFLSGRIAFLNRKIDTFAGYTASSRLCMYLRDNLSASGDSVTLPCSLSDFAGVLGVGRASLYRSLTALEQHGAIARTGRIIKVLNIDNLYKEDQ